MPDRPTDVLRVVLDLDPGTGRISGRFRVAGGDVVTSFVGWMELFALLEAARAGAGPTTPDTEEV